MPVLADRVREVTSSTGTGTVALGGAVPGFRAFVPTVGDEAQVYYAITNREGEEWEVGIGTVGDGPPSLSRDVILGSSNNNNVVSFPSGFKDVFITLPAVRVALLDPTGRLLTEMAPDRTLGSLQNVVSGVNNPAFRSMMYHDGVNWSHRPQASQADAEEGEAENRYMSPLRTAQAIAALSESWTFLGEDEVGATPTTLNITNIPDRDEYLLLYEVAPEEEGRLEMRLNGSSTDSHYRGQAFAMAGTPALSSWTTLARLMGATNDDNQVGRLTMTKQAGGFGIEGSGGQFSSSPDLNIYRGVFNTFGGPLTSIQLLWSVDQIFSGNIRLYGRNFL